MEKVLRGQTNPATMCGAPTVQLFTPTVSMLQLPYFSG